MIVVKGDLYHEIYFFQYKLYFIICILNIGIYTLKKTYIKK